MRAVIQRVEYSRVLVEECEISKIGKGLLVLLGVERDDVREDADALLEKIIHLRIFEDPLGRMNLSLQDICGDLLVVSQFTLLADCRKGRRPSFTGAEEPEAARKLYEYFAGQAALKVKRVETGEFQAMMKVEIVNDGPVTILMDSRKTF